MKKFISLIVALSFFLSLSFNFSTPQIFAYYSNMPASIVIGQTDFTSSTTGTSQSQLSNGLRSPFVDPNGRLILADQANNRVLIWNRVPVTNGAPADLVLGQADFISGTANRGGTRAANTLNGPMGLYSDGNKLFVADTSNRRVLLWNTFPTRNGQDADLVIGQSDMASASSTCDSSHFNLPYGVFVYQGKLLVSNRASFNRVLIWNTIPTSNGATADIVLGQPDMITCSTPSTAANSLSEPRGIFVDTNSRVYIADTTNQRVLIWNTFPTRNQQPADVVVGQPNMTSSVSGSTSPAFLFNPSDVVIGSNRLFVTDSGNRRVVIYNSIPTSNGQNSDLEIGQPDFATVTTGTSSRQVTVANGLFVFNNQLFVADGSNGRVLVFNDVTSNPSLSNPTFSTLPDSKLRISGSVKLGNRGTYSLQKVLANVNGQGWGNVTNLGSGIDDGPNSTSYNYYHDFEPWAGISPKDQYSPSTGYTLAIKASSFNADEDNMFLFSPFSLDSITGNTFKFTVNQNTQRLKDNLNSYIVQYKVTDSKGNVSWINYQDKIAIGTTSVIPTTPVPVNANTFRLVALDNWGHTFNVSNEVSIVNSQLSLIHSSYSNTKDWFPLQLNSISGVNSGIISSFGLPTTGSNKTTFTLSNTNPKFSGISFSNTTVTLSVTDIKSKQTKTYTTTSQNSKWSISPSITSSSYINISVSDISGRYTQLPTLTLSSK